MINGNNNNNNVNNINYQVNIVTFGKEDTSFLTEKQRHQIVLQGLKGVGRYVELVHCNKEKEEYRNIYISNRKNMDSSILIYELGRWNLCGTDQIDRLRDEGIDFIEEEHERNKNKIGVPKGVIRMGERFVEHMKNDENGEKKAKIDKEIKLILYNNRPQITK
jgi:hypothetical protein